MTTKTKTIMDQLAAELALPRKQQNQKKIAELNLKLDKALGTELKAEDLDRAEAYERSR